MLGSMIPYEELVSALAMWRERNGLPVGAADYLGEPPAPEPVSFAAYESRPAAPEGAELDVVEDIPVSEEYVEAELGAGYGDEYDIPVDSAEDYGVAAEAADDLAPGAADEFGEAPPLDPNLAEAASEDQTVDPWAGDEQPADAIEAEATPVETPADALDDYPPLGDETIHEQPMPEADSLAAAGEEVNLDAPAADEMMLGHEPSTVDEDVAVVTDQPPVEDVGDTTQPVDPVELADQAAEAEAGLGDPGEVEATLVGVAPEPDDPEPQQ